MRICQNNTCDNEIPLRKEINGKIRHLQRRKFCLECSPFGGHNTSPTLGKVTYLCVECGENNLKKFYKYRSKLCKRCDNARNVQKTRDMRKRIVEYMGSKCKKCGYDKYIGALDIHHCDPTLKDTTFGSYRFWKWDRVVKELENCILLCRNCHAEEHSYESGYS